MVFQGGDVLHSVNLPCSLKCLLCQCACLFLREWCYVAALFSEFVIGEGEPRDEER